MKSNLIKEVFEYDDKSNGTDIVDKGTEVFIKFHKSVKYNLKKQTKEEIVKNMIFP